MTYQTVQQSIQSVITEAVRKLGVAELPEIRFTEPPSPDMGDISFACFEVAKAIKKNPAEVACELAEAIPPNEIIKEARAVGPYVNFFIRDEALFESIVLRAREDVEQVGKSDIGRGEIIVLEYLSPNTNKPLHIGHIRNACLGDAMARILESQGWKVERVQIINDRGAHICKSMLMYQKYGEGKTPQQDGVKPDHFVGKFYEMFEREAAEHPELQEEAQEMLRKWESGDKQTRELWQKLNDWVYEGWKETIANLGVESEKDRLYYESEIYEKGKEVVEKGLRQGIFYKRDDGAVEIDLTAEGLDKKVLLRSDGTSIYITQDLYLAELRAEEYPKASTCIYVVGKDQEYHFKALFILLKKLGLNKTYYHLSYGLMRLKEGKMSSRKGTVVHADELIEEVYNLAGNEYIKRYKLDFRAQRSDMSRLEANRHTRESTKRTEEEIIDDLKNQRQEQVFAIGLAALKYYLLSVDPSKDIIFDAEQAVRFEGATGPYIQYTYARMRSIRIKNQESRIENAARAQEFEIVLNQEERVIINKLAQFQSIIEKSAREYSPAHLAHYLFELAESINSFYHKHQVLKAAEGDREKRLRLLDACAVVLEKGLSLLGIEAVERM